MHAGWTVLSSLIFSVVLVVSIRVQIREQSHSEHYGSEGIIVEIRLPTSVGRIEE